MRKYAIIDSRMRIVEKEKIKSLGYELLELKRNINVYEEISSHVDIFCTKLKDKLILDKNIYDEFIKKISNNILCGESEIRCQYPLDVPFNVCNIGNFAIHNFKYTDKTVLDTIDKLNLKKINICQGYSNCSIAVIDDNSCIVTDKKIYEILKEHNIQVLYLDYNLDIKLLNGDGYSNMNGFIGGAMSKIGDNIIIFGDLRKIDKHNKIKNFIFSRKLNIIDFKYLDVIDYGGILEV